MECNIMPPISAMSTATMYSLVSINIVTSILTVIVNYCFVAGMLGQKNLLTPTNLFIISLSVSDFLVGLIVQPLACALLLLNASGSTNCVLENLVFISLSVFCGASGLCVPVISLDRYIRMKKLQYYIKYVSKRRACIAIACIWVNALAFAFTPFYGVPQDIFFIMLIIYLVGCGLVMSVAYRSVVQRSVVFQKKHDKQNEECKVIYTKKKTSCPQDKQETKQSLSLMEHDPQMCQGASEDKMEPDLTPCQFTFSEEVASSSKSASYQAPTAESPDNKSQSCFPSKCSFCNDAEDIRSDSFESSQGMTSSDRPRPDPRKRLASSLENSRQMRITVTVCLLVLVIIISWMPTFVFSLIWALDKPNMNSHEMVVTLHYIALTFGFACSCVNPLLYCSRIRDVRKAAIGVFWRTFKCACCSKH